MAVTDRDTSLNYLGELFLVGAYATPFLNMIGGLDGAKAKITKSMIFPNAQPYSLASAAIPAMTESQLVAAGTPTTVSRSQTLNTVQIFKQDVVVSYLKTAAYGELSGLAALGDQPVTDEMAFQKQAALRQIAINAEKTFLTGVYAAAVNDTTAAQTNGIITACTSNTVAAGGAYITKSLVDSLLLMMAASGAVFENMVLFCNGFQKQKISSIYGYAPEDRNVGGVNVQQIETDFCKVGVIYDPQIPAGTVLVADMNYCFPVFLPFRGQTLFYEDLAKTSGAERGQFVGFMGLEYGPIQYHGTVTGLATA